MRPMLICAKGHQWESIEITGDSNPSHCPVCGDRGDPLPDTHEPETAEYQRGHTAHDEDGVIPPFRKSSGKPLSTLLRANRAFQHRLPDIPGFEVLGEIGEGGMGVVFKARDLGLNREVALKMLSSGAAARKSELERLQMEAEAIARLKHDHIVQIYGIGQHEGCAYLSLELVGGGNLQEQSHGAPQPLRHAVELVRSIARAVHYAHQNGIVHRDLKPHNILLTADGRPKITDFGLAKHLEGTSQQTQTGAVIGTPNYMSPEQAAGRTGQVGPLTDVYGLGGILYYLLTGRPPHIGETGIETLRSVTESEPVPPKLLNPRVSRDLQTICLKCLEKDPRKRYESAEAVADELRRILDGQPIHARPVGWPTRFTRWCGRNPRVAGLAALLMMVTLCGVLGVLWQWRHAESQSRLATVNFQTARQAVDKFYNEVSQNKLLDVPGLQPLRKELLESALQYYQDFIEHDTGNPDLRNELAQSHFRVGQITALVGSRQDALREFNRAREITADLLRENPDDVNLNIRMARIHNASGRLQRELGEPENAMSSAEAAGQLSVALLDQYPHIEGIATELASSVNNIAMLHLDAGNAISAEEAFQIAISVLGPLADGGAGPEIHDALAGVYNNYGNLHWQSGDLPKAASSYEQAAGIQATLISLSPEVQDYRADLGRSFYNLANVHAESDDPEAAQQAYEQSLMIFDELAEQNPSVTSYQYRLANVHTEIGLFRKSLDQQDLARQSLQQAIDIGEKIVARNPEVTEYRATLARTCHNLGSFHYEAGDHAAATEAMDEAIRIRQALAEENPNVVVYRELLSDTLNNLALTLSDQGKPVEALARLELALELKQALVENHPENVRYRYDLSLVYETQGQVLWQTGRPEKAETALVKCLETAGDQVPETAHSAFLPIRIEAHRLLSTVLADLGRYEDALQESERAVALSQGALPIILAEQARTLALAGQHARCAAAVQEAVPAADNDGDVLFTAARALAIASRVVLADEALAAPARTRQSESYQREAIRLIDQVLAAANEPTPARLEQLKSAEDFEAMRSRPDFVELIHELQ